MQIRSDSVEGCLLDLSNFHHSLSTFFEILAESVGREPFVVDLSSLNSIKNLFGAFEKDVRNWDKNPPHPNQIDFEKIALDMAESAYVLTNPEAWFSAILHSIRYSIFGMTNPYMLESNNANPTQGASDGAAISV